MTRGTLTIRPRLRNYSGDIWIKVGATIILYFRIRGRFSDVWSYLAGILIQDLGDSGMLFCSNEEMGGLSPAYLPYLSGSENLRLMPGKGIHGIRGRKFICTELIQQILDTPGRVWVHDSVCLITPWCGQKFQRNSGNDWKLLTDCFGEIQIPQTESLVFSEIHIMNCSLSRTAFVWRKGISRLVENPKIGFGERSMGIWSKKDF